MVRTSLHPQSPRSRATRALVISNLGAFALVGWLRFVGISWVNAAWGMVPARLSADPVGEASKLITGLFVHDGFAHLLWNLVFLLLFGRRVERALGASRFVFFYLLTGVLSSVAQFSVGPNSPIPLVGSSGAIAGLLGGFLVLFPKEPVTFLHVPAYQLIGLWFGLNLIGGLASLGGSNSDTAFFAHLGGFAAGLLLIRFFSKDHSLDSGLPSYHEAPRVVRRPIFSKNSQGPFWRT
jgi:membrane associated rhomboid family serine protease